MTNTVVTSQVDSLEEHVTRKTRWRLVPLLALLYIIAYIDRNNLGYISLEMNKALGISPAAYGMLAGIFALGYVPFEIPSNILLYRYGASKWFCRILVSWGTAVIITGLCNNLHQLYVMRVLLGAAEAGFYPGVVLFLSFWFTPKERARVVALFQLGMPLSNFIGAPIATSIMHYVHWYGIPGWRWVFYLEGLPAILAGIWVLFYLPDRPEKAKWLSRDEKNWLVTVMQKEHEAKVRTKHYSKWEAFCSFRVLRFAFAYLFLTSAQVGMGFWLPQIIKGLSKTLTIQQVGFVAMGPYVVGALAMYAWSRHSDRNRERRLHTAFAVLVGSAGLVLFGVLAHFAVGLLWEMLAITVALMGVYAFFGPFWAMPAQFLSEGSAAVGVATINSIACFGSFLGPWVIGYATSKTGTPITALYIFAGGLFVTFLLTVTMSKAMTRDKYIDEEAAAAVR